MKKNIGKIGILFVLVFSLVACSASSDSKKEEQVSYYNEANGVTMTVTFYHTGDNVTKQVVESTINYEKIGSDKETLKKSSEEFTNIYKDIDGVKYEVKLGEKEAIETTEFDFNKIDFKKLANIPGIASGDFNENTKKISLKKSEKQVKDMGFKLKTN